MNKEGEKLIERIGEMGWVIYNGAIKGHEDGELTFTGAMGHTVIDYVMGGREVKEEVEGMWVGDNVGSDHHPLVVEIRGEGRREGGR